MKKIILSLLLLAGISAQAQFSAYDPFDDNSNEWITRNDDTASFQVKNSKLDMDIKLQGDFINAKGATLIPEKAFRTELSADYKSGIDTIPYGICWGASDLSNLHLFYITGAGKYGFKTMQNRKWTDVVLPTSSSSIIARGSNWLRMNVIIDKEGKKKIALVINEEIIRTIDYVIPFGSYFGAYVGGKQHILFDDFIVYQRGVTQEEFEPCDLSLSLACKANQLHYTNTIYNWTCCVEKNCRIDVDSTVTRFWFTNNRTGDYSVLVVPFPSLGNVTFEKAVEQDFGDYMAEGDSIIAVKKDEIKLSTIGRETKVYQIGEVYSSYDLKGNLYVRRYYVDHPYGNEKGIVFQFITSENSPYIPILDQLVQQIIESLEFR